LTWRWCATRNTFTFLNGYQQPKATMTFTGRSLLASRTEAPDDTMTLNRAVARLALFEQDADEEAFARVIAEAKQKHPARLLRHCTKPDHWHIVTWPRKESDLREFVRW
jgi:hypothetical protein